MNITNLQWFDSILIQSKKYTCGYCGENISSEKGYLCQNNYGLRVGYIYICHSCNKPTYISADEQVPGPMIGYDIKGIEDTNVSQLYNEARVCISSGAYTASVLCSRKLLMNIAVSQGAKEGLNFTEYIDYLSDKGYIPPNGKKWVDIIRKKGNEATHKINIMKIEDAAELINFSGMLLKFIYEFPSLVESNNK